MAIFSISDIVISITLVINALALISSRVPTTQNRGGRGAADYASDESKRVGGASRFVPSAAQLASRGGIGSRGQGTEGRDSGTGGLNSVAVKTSGSESLLPTGAASLEALSTGESTSITSTSGSASPLRDASFSERLRQLVFGVRKLSCLILFWNVFFSILMILVFER